MTDTTPSATPKKSRLQRDLDRYAADPRRDKVLPDRHEIAEAATRAADKFRQTVPELAKAAIVAANTLRDFERHAHRWAERLVDDIEHEIERRWPKSA